MDDEADGSFLFLGHMSFCLSTTAEGQIKFISKQFDKILTFYNIVVPAILKKA